LLKTQRDLEKEIDTLKGKLAAKDSSDLLDKIKEKTSVHIYDTWFKPLRLLEKNETSLKIAVPNSFTADWLNSNYKTVIIDAHFETTGEKKDVFFEIKTP